MRCLLVALLLLSPAVLATAGHVVVTAPSVAVAGIPFLIQVCVVEPAELRVALLLDGKVASRNASRYGASGVGCRDIMVEPLDVAGNATLMVRARPPGGSSQAEERIPVRVERPDVPVRLVEAWGAPFAGAIIGNDGAVPVVNLTLGAVALPPLAPGVWFVGPSAPPGAPQLLLSAAPREWSLRLGARVLASLPAPKPAEVISASGAHRMGASQFPAVRALVNGSWSAFVTPDAGDAPVIALIDGAQREVLVETYTITSSDVGAALARALDRGARVRVLLEGAPVGGVPTEEKPLVAALVARGANVSFMRSAPGFPTRFPTLHAKLLVADREAVLISTENLHASSYPPIGGSPGTRGFGLVVHNASLAQEFARVMDADAAPWPDVQAADLASLPAPMGLTSAVARRAGPTLTMVGAFNATMVLSPETSAPSVEALLHRASRSIDVAMLFADAQADPMLDALVEAARHNVSVRLLLDSHVDDGRNAADVARLTSLAAREGLPLMARLADANHTLHAKLVLVDGREAYIGSMNWGRASMKENREAGLILEAPPIVAFYGEAFARDWAKQPASLSKVAPAHAVAAGPAWLPLLALVVAALTSRSSCRRW